MGRRAKAHKETDERNLGPERANYSNSCKGTAKPERKKKRQQRKRCCKDLGLSISKIDVSNLISHKEVLACARETGFVRRAGGKINPCEFLFALMFRGMASVPVGLGLLTSFLNSLVTRTGVHNKFNERAVEFFRSCLSRILLKRLDKSSCINTEFTAGFSEILIIDSTSWDIPKQLQWIFPGSGGKASNANCKLQFCYDHKMGEFRMLEDMAGSLPDQKYSRNVAGLVNKMGLVIFDLGYWVFGTFWDIHEKEGFFLSRLNTQVNLWTRDGEKFIALELSDMLANCRDRQ